jgi:hypothetical protein
MRKKIPGRSPKFDQGFKTQDFFFSLQKPRLETCLAAMIAENAAKFDM